MKLAFNLLLASRPQIENFTATEMSTTYSSIRGVESEGVSLESLIDLAYTSATLAGSVACYVSENYIETDHQAISTEIKRNQTTKVILKE